jgi:ribosomal protein S18 acetylase RimI-like enzyme
LSLYHYRGGTVPDVGREVLAAGPDPGFLSLEIDGTTAAICRVAVAEGWAGITAMEVALAYRRRGLARHLLRHAAAWAADRGAGQAYLQVDPDNVEALALYGALGFVEHHRYVYVREERLGAGR